VFSRQAVPKFEEASVFDQINGLPVHALVLHAAVIFVPLLAVGAIAYAIIPRFRPRLGWAVALLGIAAPASTFVAMESGEKLYDRLLSQGLKGRGAEILSDHMGYGEVTFWLSVALGVVSLIAVFATGRKNASLPKAADIGLAVVMIGLAAVSGYYVFKTGDSGATAVWGQY
jgi:hypothetical protein